MRERASTLVAGSLYGLKRMGARQSHFSMIAGTKAKSFFAYPWVNEQRDG
jgi:hypothetical protein